MRHNGNYPPAGNWKSWKNFVGDRASSYQRDPDNGIPDPDNWCIWYTHNRDDGLLSQSNAHAISEMMDPFTKPDDTDNSDALEEDHNHWACGWVKGYSVRVLDPDGKPTRAYETLCEIIDKLDSYPVLDESDYSEREMNATFENVCQQVDWITSKHDLELPAGVSEADAASNLAHWLCDSPEYYNELENRDDQGGWPSDEAVIAGLFALYPGIFTAEHREELDLEPIPDPLTLGEPYYPNQLLLPGVMLRE